MKNFELLYIRILQERNINFGFDGCLNSTKNCELKYQFLVNNNVSKVLCATSPYISHLCYPILEHLGFSGK